MRIHYIMHAPFEKLGAIEEWATKKHHQLSGTHTYKNEKLPTTDEFDFLIIMGGPQSPCELDKYPYLRDEIVLARNAIKKDKVVFGICLGAQIIGESLGAKTERSPHKEIGVYEVELTKEGESDPLFKLFPKQFKVMHWHNDMPGIPEGGKILAKSKGCPRQAFRYNDRVYGFQFHLEMTPELVRGMIAHCEKDLKQGQYVQTSNELMTEEFSEINQKIYLTLDHLESQLV